IRHFESLSLNGESLQAAARHNHQRGAQPFFFGRQEDRHRWFGNIRDLKERSRTAFHSFLLATRASLPRWNTRPDGKSFRRLDRRCGHERDERRTDDQRKTRYDFLHKFLEWD